MYVCVYIYIYIYVCIHTHAHFNMPFESANLPGARPTFPDRTLTNGRMISFNCLFKGSNVSCRDINVNAENPKDNVDTLKAHMEVN